MIQGKISEILTYTAYAGSLCIAAGLVFSPALQSIGVALIFLHPFLNRKISEIPKTILKNPFAWLLLLLFLATVFSVINVSNYTEFWRKVIVKLPFLLLPIGLMVPGMLSSKQVYRILLVLVTCVCIAGIFSLADYLLHFRIYNEQIIHSKPIPILFGKINHIYYSILLAFSTLSCIYFLLFPYAHHKSNTVYFSFATVLQLIFLHMISSRTGLAAFYVATAGGLFWIIIKNKKYWLGLAGMGILIAVALLAVLTVPGLKNRFENTKTDINKYKTGQDLNHYSISMRLEALKTSWNLYKKSPVLGVGAGDLESEMKAQYRLQQSTLLEENMKQPHNQFLQELTTTGLPGFLLLLFIFIFPLFSRHLKENLLFFVFLLVCFTAFQVESVIERQVGIAFFGLFYLVLPFFRNVENKQEDLVKSRWK